MTPCSCGGKWHKHCVAQRKPGSLPGTRYKCYGCGRCITVNPGGDVSSLRGRPVMQSRAGVQSN